MGTNKLIRYFVELTCIWGCVFGVLLLAVNRRRSDKHIENLRLVPFFNGLSFFCEKVSNVQGNLDMNQNKSKQERINKSIRTLIETQSRYVAICTLD